MSLTIKQEKFCFEFIRTGNKSKAYKYAYDAENMAQNTIYKEATQVSQIPKVAAKIAELRREWFKETGPSIKLQEPVTVEALWERAVTYFKWCDENPERRIEKFRINNQVIDKTVSIRRSYNMEDLCSCLRLPNGFFESLKAEAKDEFVDVAEKIEAVIYNQQENTRNIKKQMSNGFMKLLQDRIKQKKQKQ